MNESLLSIYDYAIISFYLIGVALFGYYKGRREQSTDDFFLAGRQMSWGIIFISVLATEISAVTFISVPEEGFASNYVYLQFAFGSLIGRYLIAYVLLPAFFKKKITTIYSYLKDRFGKATHICATLFFLVTRIMASGVRLFVASLALTVATGWPLIVSLSLVAVCAVIYTSFGGIKAVMWTDLLQAIIFFGGGILALIILIKSIPGGLGGIFDYVAEFKLNEGVDKMEIFRFSFNLNDSHTFLVSVLFGCFMTFAALGADQDLAQRLLTTNKLKDSQKAIIYTGYIDFPVVILFLFLGTALFVFFKHNPLLLPPDNTAKVFPFYVVNVLPVGIKGLLIAGVIAAAMSSLDSAMNALASSALLDLYVPYFKSDCSEKKKLFFSRLFIIVFAVLLVSFAWLCQNNDRILLLAFKLVSFTYGALLGVFCLGILSDRGTDKGNVFAMIFSAVLVAVIHFSQLFLVRENIIVEPFIGWSWYVIIGTLGCFITGFLFREKN